MKLGNLEGGQQTGPADGTWIPKVEAEGELELTVEVAAGTERTCVNRLLGKLSTLCAPFSGMEGRDEMLTILC